MYICTYSVLVVLQNVFIRGPFFWHRKQEQLCNDKIELQLLGGFCGKIPFNFKKPVILGVFIFRLWFVSASLNALQPQHLRFPSVVGAWPVLTCLSVVCMWSPAPARPYILDNSARIFPDYTSSFLKPANMAVSISLLVFINFIIRV